MKKILTYLVFFLGMQCYSQYATEYNGGMQIKLNDNGDKYLRFLFWGQTWFQDFEGNNINDGFSIKRARILAYSQINDRFLILTHFGANGIYDQNLTPSGKSNDVTFFLHEMFAQYKIVPELYVGAGLHYYNGISRANSQGTINMLTIDNQRADWSTMGLSDQSTNHLGLFFKGNIDRLNYRFSINDANVTTLDGNSATVLKDNETKYLGKALLNKAKYTYSGYVDYQFLEKESNLLAYRIGSYLGNKKVFNVGAGFFHHSDAIVSNRNNELLKNNAQHFAIDVFYDTPIGKSAALTAYGKFQHSNMGGNYLQSNVVGDGNQISGHIGYLLPKNNANFDNNQLKNRLQPYLGYSYRDFNGLEKPASELKIGTNWYVDGHNAKISLEYQHAFDQPTNKNGLLTIQAMVFL